MGSKLHLVNTVSNATGAGSTLVVGGDGRYYNNEVVQV